MEAAVEEFATWGLAGARVDRIAAAAEVSKPMIYSYFGNKDALFDAAFAHEVLGVADVVPFTVDDLAEYAVQMHDYYMAHPRLWRFLLWAGLERGTDAMAFERGDDARHLKVEQLSAAQADGRVADSLKPDLLLRVIVAVSQMWCANEASGQKSDDLGRREAVRRTVEKLISD